MAFDLLYSPVTLHLAALEKIVVLKALTGLKILLLCALVSEPAAFAKTDCEPELLKAAAFISSWRLPEFSIAERLVTFAYGERLVDLKGLEVRARNLLVAGHGICTSACAAAITLTGRPGGDHLDEIVKFMTDVFDHSGRDPRYGLSLDAAEDHFRRRHAAAGLAIAPTGAIRSLGDVALVPGDVMMASVRMEKQQQSHAIVILATDLREQDFLFYDPNSPRRLGVEHFNFDGNGVTIARFYGNDDARLNAVMHLAFQRHPVPTVGRRELIPAE